MAKLRTLFFCTECGNESARWEGQCSACGGWNTLVEAPTAKRTKPGRAAAAPAESSVIRLRDVSADAAGRWSTGIGELDFVLGGGVVPGSIVLIGGEPGIGKSTLLLQAAARLEGAGHRSLYVSGEESAAQVAMRAARLAGPVGDVTFLAHTDVEEILVRAAELQPAVLFIDSIQTMRAADVEGAPGNVNQVRECAARLQRYAKDSGAAVFLVGHVTKGGVVAGPRTLEHIVDTVLYFEAAGGLDHRVLRTTKNRFGGADELGVFRMTGEGLVEVENPSALFLDERPADASGCAVVPALEGTRPLLVEVQALAARAGYGSPQRVSNGFDRQRLALLLAVLERRAGLAFGERDVFVNVVGGLRLADPACDLAVACALASTTLDRPAPRDAVFIGELGLGGELRPVSQAERRIAAAARAGFTHAFLPARSVPSQRSGLTLRPVGTVAELIGELFR